MFHSSGVRVVWSGVYVSKVSVVRSSGNLMILPAFLHRYALFRVPCVLFLAMRSTQKLNLTLLMERP